MLHPNPQDRKIFEDNRLTDADVYSNYLILPHQKQNTWNCPLFYRDT